MEARHEAQQEPRADQSFGAGNKSANTRAQREDGYGERIDCIPPHFVMVFPCPSTGNRRRCRQGTSLRPVVRHPGLPIGPRPVRGGRRAPAAPHGGPCLPESWCRSLAACLGFLVADRSVTSQKLLAGRWALELVPLTRALPAPSATRPCWALAAFSAGAVMDAASSQCRPHLGKGLVQAPSAAGWCRSRSGPD